MPGELLLTIKVIDLVGDSKPVNEDIIVSDNFQSAQKKVSL